MANDSETSDMLKALLEAIKGMAPHKLEELGFKAPKQGSDSRRSTVMQLDSLRRQGNQFFKESNYIGAMNLYSQCIVQSGETMESVEVWSDSEDEKLAKATRVRKILFLALSNRAETWLRLKEYRRALKDADRALQSEPNHAKCLVRRGKSLDGLQRYEEAVFCFTAALQLFPDDIQIQNSLRCSKICHLQSHEGDFDFSKCDGEVLDPICEFVGPVEIRMTEGDGSAGRGVFLTKSATAGQLLLVSNALGALGGDPSERKSLRAMEDYWIARATGSLLPTEDDLALQLAFTVKESSELRAKLDTLFMGGSHQTKKSQQAAIPDMRLFKPGAEWNSERCSSGNWRPSGETLESMVDGNKERIARIRKVIEYNAFTDFDEWGRAYSGKAGRDKYLKAGCGGLWLLPSFLNHSCSPNCTKAYVGNALFVRASRTVEVGEELCLAYCDVSLGVDSRRDRLRKWGFECRCQRCVSESAPVVAG